MYLKLAQIISKILNPAGDEFNDIELNTNPNKAIDSPSAKLLKNIFAEKILPNFLESVEFWRRVTLGADQDSEKRTLKAWNVIETKKLSVVTATKNIGKARRLPIMMM